MEKSMSAWKQRGYKRSQSSNAFAVLPASSVANINAANGTIASSSSHARLAAGHPKLNRGRMFRKHPAAVLITANRARWWR